jgi:ABC-type uncharacterized transport system permease subunit
MQILGTFKIVERQDTSKINQIIVLIISLIASFLIAALLISQAGGDPMLALTSILKGAFGGQREILETLVRASPLLLVAVGTVVAFSGSIWNIGQEGQLIAGAMLSYWVYTFIQDWPRFPLLIVIILSGFVGGALLASLAALLRTHFRVDIVIGTVLINYITLYFFSMLLWDYDLWMDIRSYNPRTPQIIEAARLPQLFEGSRLHLGIILGMIAALVIAWVMQKSSFGIDVRSIGLNPVASKFRGINFNRTLITTMIISGGLCGLAGMSEAFGLQYKLDLELSPGLGFTGLIVAMLAGLDPIASIVASIFFGGLINGGVRMVTVTGVPTALIKSIQAIVLIFLLIGRVASRMRIRRVTDV